MLPSVLLVDDDPSILRGFARFLSAAGYDISQAATLAEARRLIATESFSAVILDQYLPDGQGIDWIPELRADQPGMAIILVTGEGDIPTAVEAMRRGGDNFLTKPVNMQELDVFLRKSLELGALRQREFVRHRISGKGDICWGESNAMERVRDLARMASESDTPVLIQGETGTGKGMLSRWIHGNSLQKHSEMIEVNCSVLRGDVLASELFGHVKGAFTSAVSSRRGLLEVANGSTLFLDEVGDMGLEVQAQFLKAIEEKRFRPMGDSRERRSNFRLICATNQDLERKKGDGTFREDLYFRINVFPIAMPALRERLEDLVPMIRCMLADLGAGDIGVAPAAVRTLQDYRWPGNIRELRNIIERALILSRGGNIGPAHLPALTETAAAHAGQVKGPRVLSEEEEKRVLDALERSDNDKKKAAVMLGISQATLYRKLARIRDDARGAVAEE